jgi:hypothetical protein
LSSTIGEPSATALRLASARRRVRAFLDQIRQLETSDFPHGDAREALTFIREYFETRQNLLRSMPDSVADSVADDVCLNTNRRLADYTVVLGFILRSTNVRNAFEIHFPLRRLVQHAVSPDARLIMSSEWNFVPFTYPMTLDLLPDFVLVGGPAPESDNPLIIPLAGHEIGHSAWRSHLVKDTVSTIALAGIDAALDRHPNRRDALVAELAHSGHDIVYLQNACLFTAMRQLEEVFCDHFGLGVFGEAFLYAYDYFLAPGGGQRTAGYPSARDRVRYLVDGARALGIEPEPRLFSSWQDSAPRLTMETEVLFFADQAVNDCVDLVRTTAFGILKDKGILPPDPDVVTRVEGAFGAKVPDGDGATLAEIVTAGWRYLRAKGGLSAVTDLDEHDMLGELMLKSIEVSEFKLRVEG